MSNEHSEIDIFSDHAYTDNMKNFYNEYAYTKMPFGKYRGWFLRDIPDDYIKWAVLNIQDRAQAEMFAIELQRRHPELRKNPVKNISM
jgi:hypothetical protein